MKPNTTDFKTELLTIARQALVESVQKRSLSQVSFTHHKLKQQLGVFVTLKKHGRLRGCIGLIESDQPLFKGVQEMTRAAALEDPRFEPVTEDELNDIQLEVSVLTQPRLVENYKEVKPGQHGVIIEYAGRKGVFLPQVATEHGYNRQELLSTLCTHKLGLESNTWKDAQAKIYVFEAEIYEEGQPD